MHLKHGCLVIFLTLQFLCAAAAHAAPERVVSTFLCTDEYVFRLLPRERIAALTVLAGNHPPVPPVVSTIADQIRGIPLITPDAETILTLEPDLVVMYQGTNPRLLANLQGAKIPVLEVPWPNSLADIRSVTRMLGKKLGVERTAEKLIAVMDAKLARAEAHKFSPPVTTLIYEPNGYATADGVTAEIISHIGLSNIAAALHPTRLGTIPVEAVVAHPPQLLILNAARETGRTRADQVLENPALAALKGKSFIAKADLKPLLCPGPWSVDVLKPLAGLGRAALALERAATPD